MIETMIKRIEDRLDSAFKTVNDINKKINQIKEEMNDSGIPNNRNEIFK